MLDAAAKLGKMVVGMNRVLGDIPVTVKLRTGVKDGRNTAHKLMPRLAPEFGAGCITVIYITFFWYLQVLTLVTIASWPHSSTALHKAG